MIKKRMKFFFFLNQIAPKPMRGSKRRINFGQPYIAWLTRSWHFWGMFVFAKLHETFRCKRNYWRRGTKVWGWVPWHQGEGLFYSVKLSLPFAEYFIFTSCMYIQEPSLNTNLCSYNLNNNTCILMKLI